MLKMFAVVFVFPFYYLLYSIAISHVNKLFPYWKKILIFFLLILFKRFYFPFILKVLS